MEKPGWSIMKWGVLNQTFWLRGALMFFLATFKRLKGNSIFFIAKLETLKTPRLLRTHLGNLSPAPNLPRSSVFMSLTHYFDSLPLEQASESSGQHLSLLWLCPLYPFCVALYGLLKRGRRNMEVCMCRCVCAEKEDKASWVGRGLRDRYGEIQKVICPSSSLRELGIIVFMTGRQRPLGPIYMRPSLLAISTQGQMRLQPAGQADYDESIQNSPVTLVLKAGEIMHHRWYVELCATCGL